VIVIAGPNGAGKSTTAPAILQGRLAVKDFVNADVIAQGLSAFRPEGVAFQAGRVMLGRIKDIAVRRMNFAFETTMASRSFEPWLQELVQSGYCLRVVFLWLPSADLAVARVAVRVRLGGHDVPEETIRRRYRSGLTNFFRRYQPLTTTWRMYDHSQSRSRLIAAGRRKTPRLVSQRGLWESIVKEAER
jgi:predicted ABC-type ATPase